MNFSIQLAQESNVESKLCDWLMPLTERRVNEDFSCSRQIIENKNIFIYAFYGKRSTVDTLR